MDRQRGALRGYVLPLRKAFLLRQADAEKYLLAEHLSLELLAGGTHGLWESFHPMPIHGQGQGPGPAWLAYAGPP